MHYIKMELDQEEITRRQSIPNIFLKCFPKILGWHGAQYVHQRIFVFGFSANEQRNNVINN